MALEAGTRLGPYEVTAQIGKGGMGEVYRARDTGLDRDVAIKVLPAEFASDPERLARFEREAKVLASLNHPNIAHIHGLERSGDAPALILELVEGPTLQDRIAQGAIPLDEALPIAKQIAEALEAAHEQGIIHRDLKPANIKVTPDSVVKVLDFGLAKALEPEQTEAEAANSPTMTAAATKMGVLMGTAAYMSPEQAAGRPADRRADIWAFGVVLWEMLAGQQLFTGESVSHVVASVLKTEPDWNALPTATPALLRRLLRRCLEKDRKRRLQHVGDARADIDDARTIEIPPSTGAASLARVALWQRPVPLMLGAALLVAVTGLAVWSLTRSEEAPPRVGRFILTDQGNEPVNRSGGQPDVALSPDGTTVVYMAGRSNEESSLTVRAVDQLVGVPLDATVAPRSFNPFVSPDGEWVGYLDFDTVTLNKVSIHGGPAIVLCEIAQDLDGASWSVDDTIIFGSRPPSGLWRVSAAGGEPEALTTLDAESGEVNHGWPDVLPGGRSVLFTILTGNLDTAQIAVADVTTGDYRVLVPGGHAPRYAASGHIVYAASGTLRAVGFDLDTLEVVGTPVPVLDGVGTKPITGAASFDLATDGSLAYVSNPIGSALPLRTLAWVDRQGNEEPLTAEPRSYVHPRISPEGTRVALDVRDEEDDIWIWDLARQAMTKLTFGAQRDGYPAWTPDGRRVVFRSTRDGATNLYSRAADGTGAAERLTDTENSGNMAPGGFTPDGTQLVFGRGRDLRVLSMDGERSSGPLLATEFQESTPELSPDGRWLAYESDASGQFEIFVRPFPNVDEGRWPVSTGGGVQPLWARDGGELFYRIAGGGVVAVAIETNPRFRPGPPAVVFEGNYYLGGDAGRRNYDISPDGERFLMIKDNAVADGTEAEAEAQVVLVLNFFEELKARVPTGQ